ncbi:hypothetical protein [Bacillus sp. MRMR6]|uniref:hypothetical protein n=1 Tax=Bacillus sp. MRMR6 TaxID=1928617 RepID=UPI00095165F9|nr:hypothetical protein [Bacillus sp. MRMR6]OLS33682.1 hypothetical protein BTR25_24660 [Bacillus sp. MRMR6]
MNFRQFLISGLVVGAAMLVPDMAFAEKPNGVQHPQKANIEAKASVKSNNEKLDSVSVQAGSSANASLADERGKISEKSAAPPKVVEEQHSKGQDRQPAVSDKASQVLDRMPEQAKGKVQSAVKKTEKELDARKANDLDISSKLTIINSEPEPKIQSPVVPVEGSSQDEFSEPPVQIAVQEEENSVNREKLPDVNQVPKPTQRTGHSSGHSNERIQGGINTLSLVDKWFEWDTSYEILLVEPFLSRLSLMNNQWVNAPPSPPPQKASLLKV